VNLDTLKEARDAAAAELHERKAELDALDARVAEAKPEEREALTAEIETATTAFDDAAVEAERTKRNHDDAERREQIVRDNPVAARATVPSVRTSEPPVYGPESGERNDFITDAFRMHANADPIARERLERHGRQVMEQLREKGIQLRDVGTGAFAGLTIPQYLIDMYAPAALAKAPILTYIASKKVLPPSGMTLNISRLTTSSAVAAQATENAAVQETDMDDTLLTINVNTYAGQQDVSRQALDRSEGVQDAVFQDLVNNYFTKVDADLLNGAGTSGTHLGIRSVSGINAVTYTDASPTVPELYSKMADAVQRINANVFAPATHWIVHPRRHGWFMAALDSSNRPLIVPTQTTAFNPVGVGPAAAYGQTVYGVLGLPMITDGNIVTNLGAGTNQDTVLAVTGDNIVYWSETGDLMPRQLRFEQSNAPQSVRLAVFGYSAFTAGRYPAASSTIDGTGLVAPTF
jgi:HK97 family phage major capsid protein